MSSSLKVAVLPLAGFMFAAGCSCQPDETAALEAAKLKKDIEEIRLRLTALEQRERPTDKTLARMTNSAAVDKVDSTKTGSPPPSSDPYQSPYNEGRFTLQEDGSKLFHREVVLSVGSDALVTSSDGTMALSSTNELGRFLWGDLVVTDAKTGGKISNIGVVILDENGEATMMQQKRLTEIQEKATGAPHS
jgi:hypothetical protein